MVLFGYLTKDHIILSDQVILNFAAVISPEHAAHSIYTSVHCKFILKHMRWVVALNHKISSNPNHNNTLLKYGKIYEGMQSALET